MTADDAGDLPRQVTLVGSTGPANTGGLDRYARDLAAALRDLGWQADSTAGLGPVDTLRAFVRPPRVPSGSVIDAHFAYRALGYLRTPAPMVTHFQGPWAQESRWQNHGALRRWTKARIERAVYRRSVDHIVLSGAFGEVLSQHYGVAPWSISVIPPGVDLQRFRPARDRAALRRDLGLPEDVALVVSVRRMVPRMGLDVLLRAWAALPREDSASRQLVLVGDGPLRPDLAALAASLGLGASVQFTGRVDDAELARWYAAADVAVVPSLALEGFGLVVLEALACGTPVIATRVGGLPEALAGLADDLLVPPGDVPALAARLSGALDGSRPLPTRDRSRAHAERFDWTSVARRVAAVYDDARDPQPDPRMRVVFVDHSAELSGGELAMTRLIEAMPDVVAHVILGEDGPLVEHLRGRGISVEVLPVPPAVLGTRRGDLADGRRPPVLATLLYAVRLARRLDRIEPYVVHTNSLKSALYGGLAARLSGVPLVWHLRDRVTADALPPSAVRLVRGLARRLPDAVVANSAATAATVPGAQLLRVVPSAVPASTATRTRRAPGPLTFGMVGRLAEWKGQREFLRAFAQAFPRASSSGDIRARVIGGAMFDDRAYADSLPVLAAELGIADRVDFAGFRADVSAELAGLDALVHFSTQPEPFGQVVVEGMAACLPVVASAAGGPAEVITDGVDGLLVPMGRVDLLASALELLAGSPSLRARLGAAGRATAERYAPERVGAEVQSVYEDVIARRWR